MFLPINKAIKQKWVNIVVNNYLHSRQRLFIRIFRQARHLKKKKIRRNKNKKPRAKFKVQGTYNHRII